MTSFARSCASGDGSVTLRERLTVENYRGHPVPRVLGLLLIGGGALSFLLAVIADQPTSSPWVSGQDWLIAAAAGLVFAAGLIDDLVPVGPRGLRGHLRELASGRMTTGILKLLVTLGGAVVVLAVMDRGGTAARVGAVILVAATTNVFNGLDVRPGRALKGYFLALLLGLFPIWAEGDVVVDLFLGLSLPSAVALVLDLRERAMLGDSGSNLLGFVVGAQLAGLLLPTAIWIWVAAIGTVGLNVVADTVTFSRVIDTVPPLRWFDRLGRLPVE